MLVSVTGCVADPGFHCTSGGQCEGGPAAGTCESTGYCSFADPICTGSQRRYGDSSADLSGQCVPACQPESDAVLCAAASKTCDSWSGLDNCGAQRVAICGAPCPNVQIGAVTTGTSTLTMPLPTASSLGTLLVATLTFDKAADPVGPSGWLRWSAYSTSNDGELWFYVNNPGGVTSATFTCTGATVSVGQVSEWRFGTNDVGNWCWQSNSASTLACTATGNTTHDGTLAISVFSEIVGTAAPLAMTGSTGWTVLGDNQTASTKLHYLASYQLGVPSGSSVSDTVTTTASGIWASALTTFY
jgi:hypothetical protein